MRGPIPRTLGLALGLSALAACTSSPADTIQPLNSSSGDVTGGEIIISGDLNDGDPANPAGSTIEPPAPASSTTAAPTTTPVTVAEPATTTTQAAATTAPAPATTEADVIGDGPVLTSPADDATSEAPGVDGGLVPAFFALEATTTVDCTQANPGTATLRWEVIGAEAVDIAIGSATQIFRLAQTPAGTLDVPLDCADGSTYFVVASNADGATTRSVTLAADTAG